MMPEECIPLLSGWRQAPFPWRIPHALRYAGIVLLVLLCGWRWRAGMAGAATFERARFPADAVAFLERSRPAGQIFNAYSFGGYLVWRLYPEYRVYVDGRADLYGDAFLARFNELYQGQMDPQPEFLRRNIRTVLVEPGAPIASLLSITRGWSKVYQDPRRRHLHARGRASSRLTRATQMARALTWHGGAPHIFGK